MLTPFVLQLDQAIIYYLPAKTYSFKVAPDNWRIKARSHGEHTSHHISWAPEPPFKRQTFSLRSTTIVLWEVDSPCPHFLFLKTLLLLFVNDKLALRPETAFLVTILDIYHYTAALVTMGKHRTHAKCLSMDAQIKKMLHNYTQGIFTQSKKGRKICHLQHRWDQRVLC
jgi:hypothetical protein